MKIREDWLHDLRVDVARASGEAEWYGSSDLIDLGMIGSLRKRVDDQQEQVSTVCVSTRRSSTTHSIRRGFDAFHRQSGKGTMPFMR